MTARQWSLALVIACLIGLAVWAISDQVINHGDRPTAAVVAPTPMPTAIVQPLPVGTASPDGPSPSPIPSETPAETPSPTFDYSRPPIPTPTLTPAARGKLQATLDAWLAGKPRVSKAKRFTFGLDTGYRLNLLGDNTNLHRVWELQGWYLGHEIIAGHLIMYVGHEDKYKGHYYVPVNLGPLNSGKAIHANEAASDGVNSADSGTIWPAISLNDLAGTIDGLLGGYSIIYPVYRVHSDEVAPYFTKHDLNAAAKLGNQFVKWNLALVKASAPKRHYGSDALLRRYPLVRALLNHRVTRFDAARTLYTYAFLVRNPALHP